METDPEQPLDAPEPTRPGLALCLSGGGYRAAAFHLGVLDALDRLGLLGELRVLSTISGGTIAGAAYALATAAGEPFPAFARRFRRTLATRNVVAEAFRALATPDPAGRAPSLIRAAAGVYATPDFVGAATLDALIDATARPDALVFGATEFRTGLAFRLQTDRTADAVVGAGPRLRVADAVAREIRVADAVAASSCFPSVFEPLRFPDDFRWARPLDAVRADLGPGFEAPLPLMDGGVFDNQGVDGVLQTYRRWKASADLLLVSDTSPPTEDYLDYPVKPARGRLTLRAVYGIGWLLFAGALVSAAMLATTAGLRWGAGAWNTVRDVFLIGIPFVFSLATAVGLWWVRWRFRRELRLVREHTAVQLWPALRSLTVPDAVDLAEGRVRSLVALASSIFMKRVRRLIQDALVHDERLRGRVAFGLIYDMDRPNEKLFEEAPWLRPSAALVALARRAAAVPTLLWSQGDDELRDLVACGQATTCFTLLRQFRDADPAAHVGRVPAATIVERARALWERMQGDPGALADGG